MQGGMPPSSFMAGVSRWATQDDKAEGFPATREASRLVPKNSQPMSAQFVEHLSYFAAAIETLSSAWARATAWAMTFA